MPAPVLNAVAQRIYDQVQPVAYDDAAQGWALAHFIQAWTAAMMQIEEIVRDNPVTGAPGWSSVMNPDTAPDLFLDWLAQFVGSKAVVGETSDSKRLRIKALAGLRRGGVEALRAELARTLTGAKHVIFNERQGGNAWRLGIATLLSETPNQADTLNAILSQKPAAITLDYLAAPGQTYGTLRIAHDTYQEVKDTYANYEDLLLNLPI